MARRDKAQKVEKADKVETADKAVKVDKADKVEKADKADGTGEAPALSKKDRRRLANSLAGMQRRLVKAEALVAKRTAQLESANSRRTELVQGLAAISHAVDARGEAAHDVVLAYCIREHTRVTMRDPRPVVLANGRNALAGTCTSCGAKLMRLVGA